MSTPSSALLESSTSETSPHILLHPTVLITVNDHASRAGMKKNGPVVGALLGRYDGKQIVVEEGFEIGSKKLGNNAESPNIDATWMKRMVSLQSEIHKELVLVGWYTFGNELQPWHAAIQSQLRTTFEVEAPVFLQYQTQLLRDSQAKESLPFAMYEGVPAPVKNDDSGMDVDDASGTRNQGDKFRMIEYSLDTPNEQAIGLADIMQGATAATAISELFAANTSDASTSSVKAKDTNETGGTAQINGSATQNASQNDGLLPEEDELISALSTKADAIRMLQTRLETITTFLNSQPASYLTDASISPAPGPDHEILRIVQTLTASLTLTSPSGLAGYSKDTEQAKTDGKLLELLAQLTQNVGIVKSLGTHHAAADSRKRRMETGPMSSIEGMNSRAQYDVVGRDWN